MAATPALTLALSLAVLAGGTAAAATTVPPPEPAPGLATTPAPVPAPDPVAAPADGVIPRDPGRRPVLVRVQVDQPTTIRLRVSRAGSVVALTPPVDVSPGTRRIVWRGGRGPDAAGAPVADGEYTLQAITRAGRGLPTTPGRVVVDRTAPSVVLSVPEPDIPDDAGAGPGIRVSDRDGEGTVVRAVVTRVSDGRVLASGPWAAPRDGTLPVPGSLARRGVVGAVRVAAEARDRAGNRGKSTPVVWSVQPSPGGAQVVTHVRTNRRVVALTYDDGYDPGAIASLLSTAAAGKATITFCFNGVNAGVWSSSLRASMRRATADGTMETCNHGYSHTTGTGTSQAFGESDLARNVVFDRAAGLTSVPFYRPPYGAIGPGLMAAAGALGFRYVLLWSTDTNDWRGPSSGAIEAQVLREARPGSIILMHAKGNSAGALPGILSGLRARGLTPVGIGELLSSGTPAR